MRAMGASGASSAQMARDRSARHEKKVVTSSSAQVKDGVELVNHAGVSLNEIVESIKKVSAVVSDIANASLEQSSGIEEINKALTQMDEITQQNSALVEENAATTKTLEQQARAMDERVAFFRLRDGGAQERPAATAEPASSNRMQRSASAPKRAALAR